MAKIIFGGAFDPIHLGHTNMAKMASAQYDADVIFVPARISVWKDKSINAEDKLNMIKLAIKDEPRFSISTFELESKKAVNYSYDTLTHFKKMYPNEKLYFLIGADQVNNFHLWKKSKGIVDIVQIIFYNRPNYDISLDNVKKYKMQEITGKTVEAASMNIRKLNSLPLNWDVAKYIEDNNLYYIEKIKNSMSEHRFNHVKSVANLAYEIAVANHIDNPSRAYIAGLLHDIAKEYSPRETRKIMRENYVKYINLGKWSYHQFVGRYLAENRFGITDREILDAIQYHATGNSNMHTLAKIIYAADKIEPTRGFDSKPLIDAMKKDAEEGFITVLKANKEFLESRHKDLNNRLTYKCFKQYL